MMNILLKSFISILLLFYTGNADAQNPIKRKGTSSGRAISVQRNTPKKKSVTRHSTRSSANGNRSIVVDSVAVVDDDERLKNTQTASGFPMMGRIRIDYRDNAEAQQSLCKAIDGHSNVKTVCLTDHKGIFVYGGNGYSANGLNDDMIAALNYCNQNKYTINDIAVTDIGWWCVVFEQNKYKGNLPEECREKLDQYIKNGENLLSISISENGHYAIVTDKHVIASNELDLKVLEVAKETFGRINSVCITNGGIIVPCSDGIFFWDVPSNIIEKLESGKGTPNVVRFTDSGTYIAVDGKGLKLYYM